MRTRVLLLALLTAVTLAGCGSSSSGSSVDPSLLGSVLALLGFGAALATTRQRTHLLPLALGPPGALTRGLDVTVSLHGAPVGLLNIAGVVAGIAAQLLAQPVALLAQPPQLLTGGATVKPLSRAQDGS